LVGKDVCSEVKDVCLDAKDAWSVVRFGGPSVPCAIVVCENCGNVSFHAMGALGLMAEISPPEENKNGGNNE